MHAVKTFGGRSTNSEKKVGSKKKPSYLRKHGYNIFDNYFMITTKQKKKVFADDSDETDLSDDEILGEPKTNKKGDRRSPANYRGITLTLSCLSKLCIG